MEDSTKSKLTDEHMIGIPKAEAAKKTESSFLSFLLLLLLLILFLILIIGPLSGDHSTSLALNPAVVSSFVSSTKINGSHLTASWDITVDLGIPVDYITCMVEFERVEASLSRSASPSRQGDDVVASTRLFRMRRTTGRNCSMQGIQVRAEDVEVAEDRFDLLRVGVSVRVWARVERFFFSDRFYFVRIDCNPDWTGSSELIHWFSMEEKKCQLHLTEQSKFDESLMRSRASRLVALDQLEQSVSTW
ncbi:hypothetical protein LINGRAHAP2_LOCUS13007 [Linum grandiflorum]